MNNRHAETDLLGLPRRMWWLWPFLVLLVVIWVITLWAVRISDTKTVLGVVASHEGLGSTARAEIAMFIPGNLSERMMGEPVRINCLTISTKGEVFREASEILSSQDIQDWVGSRLLADTLASKAVRLQFVLTQSSSSLPQPGEHCDLIILSGRIRLLNLLWLGHHK